MRERLLPTIVAAAVVLLPIALLSLAGSLGRSQSWLSWFDRALLRSNEVMTGAATDETEAVGFAPLHLAALTGDAHQAMELLRRGADVNVLASRKRTPLYFAAAAGRTAVVELLLRAGADPTLRADNGLRPIDAAQSAGHEPIVQMLSRLTAGPSGVHHQQALVRPLIRVRA